MTDSTVELSLYGVCRVFLPAKGGSAPVLDGLNVDITASTLKIALDTQVAMGNLAGQPDYATFIRRDFIAKATAGH